MNPILPEDRLARIRDLANGLRLQDPPEAAPDPAPAASEPAGPEATSEERLAQARELAGLPPLPASSEPPVVPVFPVLSPSAQYQEILDTRRQENARIRESARREATIVEWSEFLESRAAAAEAVEATWKGRKRKTRRLTGGSLLAQVTDVHFGADLKVEGNVYNLGVAATRLSAFSAEIIGIGGAYNVPKLTIALTGDIFDSKIGKMRYDKQVQSEGPAVVSFVRGRDLIFQFIDELIEQGGFEEVRVVGIAGNEARLTFERNHADAAAVENWDALLNSEIASRYAHRKNVSCEFGVSQFLFEIEGWNCLLKHGDQGVPRDLDQKKIQSILYAHGGDFGISGHIHDPMISGRWCRAGSLMGTDSFAGNGLNLSGYASQTVYHLRPGVRNVHVIDLDNCDGVDPYVITPDYAGAFGVAEAA